MTSRSCPASVLLIEDDESLREGIAGFLEAHDYATAVAEDVEHALTLLESVERPCLLLIDALTIRLDWTRLLGALALDDCVATLPMVLKSVTAPTLFSRPAVVKRPIDFAILLRIVEEHCCGGARGGGKANDDRDSLLGEGSA